MFLLEYIFGRGRSTMTGGSIEKENTTVALRFLQSELLQLHVDHGGFLLVMSVISETRWGEWLVYIKLVMFVKLVREAQFGFENILT
jgi:hypothetical protein